MIAAFSPTQREDALREFPAWAYDAERDALHREIVMANFSEAFALMTRIALEAEKRDHHPEWSNVYNRISIWLTTHDAGGVSQNDIDMARIIDRIMG